MSDPIIRITGASDIPFLRADNEVVDAAGEDTRDISRPNVSGLARKRLGVRGGTRRIRLERDKLVAGLQTFIRLLYAHKGQVCTFIDSQGNEWDSLAIDFVRVSWVAAENYAGRLEAGTDAVVHVVAEYSVTYLGVT